MTLAEKVSAIVGVLTIVGFAAGAVVWASTTYASVSATSNKVNTLETTKVPSLESSVKSLDERVGKLEAASNALVQRQCLMLVQLGIQGHDCYDTP